MDYLLFEDQSIQEKKRNMYNRYSPYCDLIYYESSITKGIRLAMLVFKPQWPSYILATTHGWHMSIPEYKEQVQPVADLEYLTVHVDMRGRAFSEGHPDCNGLELMDVIDAINYVKLHYKAYIKDESVVYFQSGSGGGGNALSLVGKFPDYFAHATALYGISDYAKWYINDRDGSFVDEMQVWIGGSPATNKMAYQSRSGITTVANQITPLLMIHGAGDIRVPVMHSRNYFALAKKDITTYVEIESMGNMSHVGNSTQEQLREIEDMTDQARLMHQAPVEIPISGEFVVAGYLVTKKFAVFLNNIDNVAKIIYDLNKNLFHIISEKDIEYQIIRY